MALIQAEQKLIIMTQSLIVMHLIVKHQKLILENPNVTLKLVHKTINAVGAVAQMGKILMALVHLASTNTQLALRVHLRTALTLMAYVLAELLAMEFARTVNANTDLKLILDAIIQQIAILRFKRSSYINGKRQRRMYFIYLRHL